MKSLILSVVFFVAMPVYAANSGVAYVFIVAYNETSDGTRPPLRFADDDAARFFEFFQNSAQHIDLYATLDASSQKMFPNVAQRAQTPKRAAILDGLQRVFAQMREDIAQGHRVVFYFIYSGHGDVKQDGVGYVHLLDGLWTRADLFNSVIKASPATVNHVIIDACNAYYMVASRGGDKGATPDYSTLLRNLVAKEDLRAYPNTGVLLATSTNAEVHEWGRIEAGVFSHELRSALAGGADANGDGAVDYEEVAAFIAAANSGIVDAKARIAAFIQPPKQHLAEPVLVVGDSGVRLHLPESWLGRYYLEDDRGLRYADLHKEPGTLARLELVPRPRYYLRSEQEEFLIDPANGPGIVDAKALAPAPIQLAARGSAQDIFDQHLFSTPFGKNFVAGYSHARFLEPAIETKVQPASLGLLLPVRYASFGVAVGGAIVAGAFEAMAHSSAETYRNSAGSDAAVQRYHDRAETQHRVAQVAGAVALSGVLTAGVTYFADWLWKP